MISEDFIKKLPEHANKYIENCLEHTKEVSTSSGRVVEVMDRHIPTIQFFLLIWLPRELGKTLNRATWYRWVKLEEDDKFTEQKNEKILLKCDTIKDISELFDALAVDIVANEGKGIFFAKNKLGMSDSKKIDATIRSAEPITGMTIVNNENEDDEN